MLSGWFIILVSLLYVGLLFGIAYYGDSMIFAIMIMWVSENYSDFDLARFSTKEGKYIIRRMSFENFTRPVVEPLLEKKQAFGR